MIIRMLQWLEYEDTCRGYYNEVRWESECSTLRYWDDKSYEQHYFKRV